MFSELMFLWLPYYWDCISCGRKIAGRDDGWLLPTRSALQDIASACMLLKALSKPPHSFVILLGVIIFVLARCHGLYGGLAEAVCKQDGNDQSSEPMKHGSFHIQ